jgi:hypothetical protein
VGELGLALLSGADVHLCFVASRFAVTGAVRLSYMTHLGTSSVARTTFGSAG